MKTIAQQFKIGVMLTVIAMILALCSCGEEPAPVLPVSFAYTCPWGCDYQLSRNDEVLASGKHKSFEGEEQTFYFTVGQLASVRIFNQVNPCQDPDNKFPCRDGSPSGLSTNFVSLAEIFTGRVSRRFDEDRRGDKELLITWLVEE